MSKDKGICFRCLHARLAKPYPDDSFIYCAAFEESVRVFENNVVRGPRHSPMVRFMIDLPARCIKFEERPTDIEIAQDMQGARLLQCFFEPRR